MYRSSAKSFAELRDYLENVPVIETHQHHTKFQKEENPLEFILSNYYMSDYKSAGGEGSLPGELPPEERYERFMQFYRKSDKTAYARGMQEGLRRCWGIESLDTCEQLKALEEKLKTRDAAMYDQTMKQLKIVAKVVDIFDLTPYIEGKITDFSKETRFALPLPPFYELHSKADLLRFQSYLGRTITCLDDYLECFDNYFQKALDFGIVCFKDQTAYRRDLAYGNPSKAEAEKAFNDIIYNPCEMFGEKAVRPLEDWLFHYFMRKAAKFDLPVQLHTGHMAGIRNDVTKANASHLIPTIELHQDVRFDLFHGNWPYMDEYLFIGKNYPNAYLNLCWVQCIDPIYCVELMKRAVMTVPHSKIFAFGGDTVSGAAEWVAGYLAQARDNVACALSELVESGWLSIGEAKQLGVDWFFNNPNEFYRLGFERV